MGRGSSISALTSAIAFKLVLRLDEPRTTDSISVCHGVSGPTARSLHLQAAPVQLHQLGRHLRSRHGPWPGSAANRHHPSSEGIGDSPPAVGGDRLDLLDRQVEAIRTPGTAGSGSPWFRSHPSSSSSHPRGAPHRAGGATTSSPASRSSKNPSAARARGRAGRCGTGPPVTSVSDNTCATLSSGKDEPAGERRRLAPTGPRRPRRRLEHPAPRAHPRQPEGTREPQAPPGAVAAHSVTEYHLADQSRHAGGPSRAGSPATGSNRRHGQRGGRGPLGHGRQRVTPGGPR